MEDQKFCQSCSMPLDNDAIKGTEKDGAISELYCRYCYQNGHFTTPDITLDEMKKMVIMQMQKGHIPQNIIDMAVASLPRLKRWETKI